MSDAATRLRRTLLRCGQWSGLAVVAGVVTGILDLGLLVAELPAAASDLPSAMVAAILLGGLYALWGLPAAWMLGALDVARFRRLLPDPVNLFCALALGFFAVTVVTFLEAPLFSDDIEFEMPPRVLRFLLLVGATGAVVLVAGPVLRICRPFADRIPRAVSLLPTLVLATGAVGALVLAHVALAAVHQYAAAAAASVVAVALLTVALRTLDRAPTPKVGGAVVAGVVLVAILAVLLPGGARDQARFTVVVHGAGSTELATALRDLFDRDGDGSAPAWVGGLDCREGDPLIAPGAREIPGDGVDQDCRGGDAPLPPGAPALDPGPPGCSPLPPGASVVVLMVDALRADALDSSTTPHLFGLAQSSQVFSRAYSPTATTKTSFPAFSAARPLSDTGANNPVVEDRYAVDATAAERFRAAGYRTAVFTVLDFHPFSRRGYSYLNAYWHDPSIPNAKRDLTTVAMARGVLDFLAGEGPPRFVLLHVADVHAPYLAPPGDRPRPASEAEAYVSVVAHVDAQLGVFLGVLRERGALEHTVVVVTADHGEELRERGREGHGFSVFEEGVRVPLLVFVPGCRPQVFEAPVSTTRLYPTVGALTGVTVPGPGLFTSTDLPTVTEGATPRVSHFQRAVIVGRHKLVVDVPNGGRMLFDLEADPGETRSLLRTRPDLAKELEAAYQRWLDAPPGWR